MKKIPLKTRKNRQKGKRDIGKLENMGYTIRQEPNTWRKKRLF